MGKCSTSPDTITKFIGDVLTCSFFTSFLWHEQWYITNCITTVYIMTYKLLYIVSLVVTMETGKHLIILYNAYINT